MKISDLQNEIGRWHLDSFPEAGGVGAWMPLMKAMEELGELASAHLRGIQNPDKLDVYDAAAKDAVADTLIALIGYASRRGWSVAELLSDVWPEVRGRSQARLRR